MALVRGVCDSHLCLLHGVTLYLQALRTFWGSNVYGMSTITLQSGVTIQTCYGIRNQHIK